MVNDYAQALDDAQVVHRGLIRELDHPESGAIRVIGPPWTMTRPQAEPTPPPLLGEERPEQPAALVSEQACGHLGLMVESRVCEQPVERGDRTRLGVVRPVDDSRQAGL